VEGEFQAAEKLVQAAAMISAQPIALQLRSYKRVLTETAYTYAVVRRCSTGQQFRYQSRSER